MKIFKLNFLNKIFYHIVVFLEQEKNILDSWYTVAFIGGILFCFNLNYEPKKILSILISSFFLFLLIRRKNIIFRFLTLLVISFILGIMATKIKLNNVKEIKYNSITKPIILPIKGKVKSITPTENHYWQILLEDIKIIDEKKEILQHYFNKNKIKITISEDNIYYDQSNFQEENINNGDEISALVKLFPLKANIVPGGYNVSLHSLCQRIIASGYAVSSIHITYKNNNHFYNKISDIRNFIYKELINNLGEKNGNFIAALLLGESKAIDEEIKNAMRIAGISHILCVSGLHLSLVSMLSFFTMRFMLNLSNFMAFNFNIKIISACFSLIVSYFYLLLSGAGIATFRAFLMTMLFLLAIILGRSCYPSRSLNIAVFIILSINPEYIFLPSFQLSFIAALSLISGYEFYIKSDYHRLKRERKTVVYKGKVKGGLIYSIKFYIFCNIYSSFLAGIITAPIVISHFYVFPTYSLINNLFAVPAVAFVLMPFSLMLLILTLFRQFISLNLLSIAINYITDYIYQILTITINKLISIINITNKLPYANYYFGYINNIDLIIFLLGFFWLAIWQSKVRFFGLIIIIISFSMMINKEKPLLIFDANLNAFAINDENNNIRFFGNKLSKFHSKIWINYFGKDNNNIDIKPIYYNGNFNKKIHDVKFNIRKNLKKCIKSDVQINLDNKIICQGNKITIDYNFIKNHPVFVIFCKKDKCKLKYEQLNF